MLTDPEALSDQLIEAKVAYNSHNRMVFAFGVFYVIGFILVAVAIYLPIEYGAWAYGPAWASGIFAFLTIILNTVLMGNYYDILLKKAGHPRLAYLKAKSRVARARG
jgi:hypothetical protein